MFQSNAFDYINVLDRAADASWTREAIITNNIANVNTVGYKRQDLDFESLLKQELGNFRYTSLDEKVKNVDLTKLSPNVYTDYAQYSYRLDGNNVDIDTEETELASEQLRYQGLTTAINSEFERMKAVIS